MKEETQELINTLEQRINKLVTESDRYHEHLRDELHSTRQELYKTQADVFDRPTWYGAFGMGVLAVGLAVVLFICGLVLYHSVYDHAYRQGYIQGHNEILRRLVPQPDQQEFEHRFHCDGNGCVEQQ